MSLPSVALVLDSDCPNVEEARASIRAALVEVGLPISWQEWDREGLNTPPELRGFGSPTILVNGRDVASTEGVAVSRPDGNSCRIYRDELGRVRGVPSLAALVRALGPSSAR